MPNRPGAAGLIFLAVSTVAAARGGTVYNVTELRTLSDCTPGSADLAILFYAGFRYAPEPREDDDSVKSAGLPLPAFPGADEVGESASGPDRLSFVPGGGETVFPVNSLASGSGGVLYTPAFAPDSVSVYRPDGSESVLSCEEGPSGFAMLLCRRAETPGVAAGAPVSFAAGFDCSVYRQTESLPSLLCAGVRWR